MKTLILSLVCLTFVSVSITSSAQSSALVDKMLDKAIKKTAKSDLSLGTLTDTKLGESEAELSDAVGSAMENALKGSRKSLDWSTDGMDVSQLASLAGSDKPFTTLLGMKEGLRGNLVSTVSDQLTKTGAMDMISKMGGNIPGLDMLGGSVAQDALAGMLTDKAIGEMDKMGAKMLKKIKI